MFGSPLYVTAASAMVVSAVPLFVWSLGGMRARRRNRADATLDQREAVLQESALDRVVLPTARAMGKHVMRLTPLGWVRALEKKVLLAGSPPSWTVERALALKLTLGVAAALGVVVWTGGPVSPGRLAMAGLGGVVGYVLPDAILYGRGRERQKLILKELPDTLDQLTISVEAGLGFDAALARVAASGTGPLAEELRRVLSEIKVGVPRAEAMKHLIDRTDVYELRHFVLALAQAEQYGLPVARVLRIQSGELRIKRRQRAEEDALKIPVKIVFPLVFCIFPALFVVLLGPAIIRVARTLF